MTLATRLSNYENRRSAQFHRETDIVPAKRGESFEHLSALSKSNIERSLSEVVERYELAKNKAQERG
jgi:hypothetical protein